MIIKALKTVNFRNLEDNRTFVFSEKENIIKGTNGAGKTSIGLAVLYLFTGRDGTGSDRTGHFRRDKNKAFEVEVIAADSEGKIFKITAVEKLSGKELYVNNQPVPRKYLETKLKIDVDVFAATWMPDYLGIIDDKKFEELLNKTVPSIDRKVLFDNFAKKELITDYSGQLNFDNPKSALAAATQDRLSLERTITRQEEKIKNYKDFSIRAAAEIPVVEYNEDEHRQARKELEAYEKAKRILLEIAEKEKAEAQKKEIEEKLAKMVLVEAPKVPKEYQEQLANYERYIRESQHLKSSINSLNAKIDAVSGIKKPKIDEAMVKKTIERIKDFERKRLEYFAAEKQREAQKQQAAELSSETTGTAEELAKNKKQLQVAEKIEEFFKRLPKMEWDMKLHNFRAVLDKDIEIVTEETLKNGTTKECFKKYYKGIPYEQLSSGEQIYVNRCFSDAIHRVSNGILAARFFDNDELVIKDAPARVIQKFRTKVEEASLEITR